MNDDSRGRTPLPMQPPQMPGYGDQPSWGGGLASNRTWVATPRMPPMSPDRMNSRATPRMPPTPPLAPNMQSPSPWENMKTANDYLPASDWKGAQGGPTYGACPCVCVCVFVPLVYSCVYTYVWCICACVCLTIARLTRKSFSYTSCVVCTDV
jgi:hypothetical protein